MEGKHCWSSLPLLLIAFVLSQTAFGLPNSTIYDPLITPAPIFDVNLLQKRTADQTCGYVSGDPNSPLVCPGISTCSFYNYYWGCCDSLSCNRPQTCANIASPYCGGVASDVCVFTQIERCSDHCVSYVRETGVGDSSRYTSWTCGPTATEILVLATPTNGGGTSDTAAANTGPSSTSSSEISNPTSSTDGTTPTNSPVHHTLSGGAIAGIVIGGIVGCILIYAFLLLVYALSQDCGRRNTDRRQDWKYTFLRGIGIRRSDGSGKDWNRSGRDVPTWLSSSTGQSRLDDDGLVLSDLNYDHRDHN
ncbi:hypothetical protein BGW36DRAFT_179650 [Talaromyces proteolyticus]|uniref:Mid2 domain-containing protein n=1 Tax=Talaromyces proteolyticus TaxID=1131652 RepID=A0AAD4KSW5_9EURO|nr:uncharacterized protein BGW36DRAFT_179650 [Talaromyces proteolyticus]KAH8695981.1 hypothetical protein BGW36DRAFT_179650 [Talaromyces proteolyticus]